MDPAEETRRLRELRLLQKQYRDQVKRIAGELSGASEIPVADSVLTTLAQVHNSILDRKRELVLTKRNLEDVASNLERASGVQRDPNETDAVYAGRCVDKIRSDVESYRDRELDLDRLASNLEQHVFGDGNVIVRNPNQSSLSYVTSCIDRLRRTKDSLIEDKRKLAVVNAGFEQRIEDILDVLAGFISPGEYREIKDRLSVSDDRGLVIQGAVLGVLSRLEIDANKAEGDFTALKEGMSNLLDVISFYLPPDDVRRASEAIDRSDNPALALQGVMMGLLGGIQLRLGKVFSPLYDPAEFERVRRLSFVEQLDAFERQAIAVSPKLLAYVSTLRDLRGIVETLSYDDPSVSVDEYDAKPDAEKSGFSLAALRRFVSSAKAGARDLVSRLYVVGDHEADRINNQPLLLQFGGLGNKLDEVSRKLEDGSNSANALDEVIRVLGGTVSPAQARGLSVAYQRAPDKAVFAANAVRDFTTAVGNSFVLFAQGLYQSPAEVQELERAKQLPLSEQIPVYVAKLGEFLRVNHDNADLVNQLRSQLRDWEFLVRTGERLGVRYDANAMTVRDFVESLAPEVMEVLEDRARTDCERAKREVTYDWLYGKLKLASDSIGWYEDGASLERLARKIISKMDDTHYFTRDEFSRLFDSLAFVRTIGPWYGRSRIHNSGSLVGEAVLNVLNVDRARYSFDEVYGKVQEKLARPVQVTVATKKLF